MMLKVSCENNAVENNTNTAINRCFINIKFLQSYTMNELKSRIITYTGIYFCSYNNVFPVISFGISRFIKVRIVGAISHNLPSFIFL